MKTLTRWLSVPVTASHADVRLAFWFGVAGGAAQLAFAAQFFARNAPDFAELAAGLALSLLVSGLLVLCGILTGRADAHCRAVSAQTRLLEFAGYALGLVILPMGFWQLSTYSLEKTGMTIGLLAVLALSLAAICLGSWSTLRKHSAPMVEQTGG